MDCSVMPPAAHVKNLRPSSDSTVYGVLARMIVKGGPEYFRRLKIGSNPEQEPLHARMVVDMVS